MPPFQVETTGFLSGMRLLEAGIIQAAGLAMRAAVKATEEAALQTRIAKHRKIAEPIKAEYLGVFAGGRVTARAIQPYLIRPVRAPYLRFQINGQWISTKLVRNKGLDPTPFMVRPREVGAQAFIYGTEFYVNEAIRRAR